MRANRKYSFLAFWKIEAYLKKMSQCEHEFALDKRTNEVRCIKCGDLDDEMQLPNAGLEKTEERDEFYRTQESFE